MRALTRTWTVSSWGTRLPSLTIFLISVPSAEPYNKKKPGESVFRYDRVSTYGSDLGAHEISGGNVGVSKLFNQLGTLSSLSGGGAAENECDFWFAKDCLDAA